MVADGRRVLSSAVSSQVALHRGHGGVVPELAARRHLELIVPVVTEALAVADVGWSDLHLVAATRGPGLPGALLVGLAAAKAIAFARELPFVGVNHLVGHLYAHALTGAAVDWPAVGLVVSGSHSDLCLLSAPGKLQLLGGTRDDAAGEAFDKVGRLLGLPYPGGPAIERVAAQGDANAIRFPRALADSPYEFSFSGLKTAVSTYLAAHREAPPADVAASFQQAVVDVLTGKAVRAVREFGARTLLLAGGVAANSALRASLQREAAAAARAAAPSGAGAGGSEVSGVADVPRGSSGHPVPEALPWKLLVPPLGLCTDNAAMIAAAGFAAWRSGRLDGWELDADPDLPLAL